MRSIVVGLAVLSGIGIALAAYFFSNASALVAGSQSNGTSAVVLVEYQTALQLCAACALGAVILASASCVVHAIGTVRHTG